MTNNKKLAPAVCGLVIAFFAMRFLLIYNDDRVGLRMTHALNMSSPYRNDHTELLKLLQSGVSSNIRISLIVQPGQSPSVPIGELERCFLPFVGDNDYVYSPLSQAVRSEDITAVGALLAHGADPNYSDSFGGSLITELFDNGWGPDTCLPNGCKLQLVGLLVEHGADINAPDSLGRSPLDYAVAALDPEAVRAFLSYGARPHYEADINWLNASWNLHPVRAREIIQALVVTGLNVHHLIDGTGVLQPKDRLSLVQYALDSGSPDEAAAYAQLGSPVEGSILESSLVRAESEHADWLFPLLIAHGANVNEYDAIYNDTPLGLTAYDGDYKSSAILLTAGASVISPYSSPIGEAAHYGNRRLVDLLLDHEKTERLSASQLGDAAIQCVEAPVEAAYRAGHGNNYETYDLTPIVAIARHVTVCSERYQIVRELITAGADVNEHDRDKLSLLFFSIIYNDQALERLAIEHGAKLDTTYDPDKLALSYRHVDVTCNGTKAKTSSAPTHKDFLGT